MSLYLICARAGVEAEETPRGNGDEISLASANGACWTSHLTCACMNKHTNVFTPFLPKVGGTESVVTVPEVMELLR